MRKIIARAMPCFPSTNNNNHQQEPPDSTLNRFWGSFDQHRQDSFYETNHTHRHQRNNQLMKCPSFSTSPTIPHQLQKNCNFQQQQNRTKNDIKKTTLHTFTPLLFLLSQKITTSPHKHNICRLCLKSLKKYLKFIFSFFNEFWMMTIVEPCSKYINFLL